MVSEYIFFVCYSYYALDIVHIILSEWLSLSHKSAICQVYHGDNKLHLDDDDFHFTLYQYA
jgi:hypothetical protein